MIVRDGRLPVRCSRSPIRQRVVRVVRRRHRAQVAYLRLGLVEDVLVAGVGFGGGAGLDGDEAEQAAREHEPGDEQHHGQLPWESINSSMGSAPRTSTRMAGCGTTRYRSPS